MDGVSQVLNDIPRAARHRLVVENRAHVPKIRRRAFVAFAHDKKVRNFVHFVSSTWRARSVPP